AGRAGGAAPRPQGAEAPPAPSGSWERSERDGVPRIRWPPSPVASAASDSSADDIPTDDLCGTSVADSGFGSGAAPVLGCSLGLGAALHRDATAGFRVTSRYLATGGRFP
ncbi:unnamed protein product, partial [Prorocentrum cordatum]